MENHFQCDSADDFEKEVHILINKIRYEFKEGYNTPLNKSVSIIQEGGKRNEGLCDIVWYISSGTSSVGGEMNPEITLKKYNKEYKKAVKYDTFINSIEDSQFGDVKDFWNAMYSEMKTLDKYIQTNGVVANTNPDFNADLFSQARNYFSECANELYGVE